MNIKPLQICSQQKNIYDISKGLSISLNINKNLYKMPLETFFLMASRKNSKRRFLFVSKLLGKHIPVNPYVPMLGGALLASAYVKAEYGTDSDITEDIISSLTKQNNFEKTYNRICSSLFKLPEEVVFIGFAETATALGHSMFNCFSENGTYIHTTRESILGMHTLVNFEEEHSHATSHRMYSTNESILNSKSPIVLIDDEITTGKTALNIIEAIQKTYPRKKYVLASLLDWRTEENIKSFHSVEKRLNIEIMPISLLSGSIEIKEDFTERGVSEKICSETINVLTDVINPKIQYINISSFFTNRVEQSSVSSSGKINSCNYLKDTGRFGISSDENTNLNSVFFNLGDYLKKFRRGNKTLCLGTGELMYIPAQIAAKMGEGISFHSTTRSPIYTGNNEVYAIKNAYSFLNPDDPAILNYLYNIPLNFYDELFIFFEREMDSAALEPLLEVLRGLGVPWINVVVLCTTPGSAHPPRFARPHAGGLMGLLGLFGFRN